MGQWSILAGKLMVCVELTFPFDVGITTNNVDIYKNINASIIKVNNFSIKSNHGYNNLFSPSKCYEIE